MILQRMPVAAMAGAVLALGGCMGRAEAEPLPPVEIPALTAEPQPFRTQTSFTDGVLGVGVTLPDGRTRALDNVRSVVDDPILGGTP